MQFALDRAPASGAARRVRANRAAIPPARHATKAWHLPASAGRRARGKAAVDLAPKLRTCTHIVCVYMRECTCAYVGSGLRDIKRFAQFLSPLIHHVNTHEGHSVLTYVYLYIYIYIYIHTYIYTYKSVKM